MYRDSIEKINTDNTVKMVNAELSDFYPNNLNILILKGVH